MVSELQRDAYVQHKESQLTMATAAELEGPHPSGMQDQMEQTSQLCPHQTNDQTNTSKSRNLCMSPDESGALRGP